MYIQVHLANMSKIPREIIKSISNLKKENQTELQISKRENLFLFVVVVLDGSMYMNIAEVANYQFVGKYLAKLLWGRYTRRKNNSKVNGMHCDEEQIISTIEPKPIG